MPSVPLPPSPAQSASPPPLQSAKETGGLGDAVPRRTYKCFNEAFLYMIKVNLPGHAVAGIATLLHKVAYSRAELEPMVAKAVAAVNTIRLPNERKQISLQMAMSPSSVPKHMKDAVQSTRKQVVSDPDAVNERHFVSDVEFFEACMCDMFDFRVAKYESCEAIIDPLIKKAGA